MSKSGGNSPTPGIPLPKSRRGPGSFFGDVGRELKKVHWPPVHETNRLTGVVIVVGGFLILFLFLLSEGLNMVIQLITRGRIG